MRLIQLNRMAKLCGLAIVLQFFACSNDKPATEEMAIRPAPVSLEKLEGHFNFGMGVHRPAVVRLLFSDDQTNFRQVAEITEQEASIFERGNQIKDLDFGMLDVAGRYLKIEAQNPGSCPKGHTREGQATWMYFDELIVN